MIKLNIILLLMIVISSSFIKKRIFLKDDKIVKIEVYTTNFVFGNPLITKKCDKYETNKGSWGLKYKTSDSEFINKIKYYLDTSECVNEKFHRFNTEAKLFVYYSSKKVDTICLSFSDYFFFNGILKKCSIPNERLLFYVDSLTQELIIMKKVDYRR